MASTSDLGQLNVPENVQGGDNVTSKIVAPDECNYIIRTPQVERTYERRYRRGSQENKDGHEQPEDMAIDMLNFLAMVKALITLKKSTEPWTHNASLVEASTSKAYESIDCKTSTSKAYEPNDCSNKETLKNTITKSPKQEKRRRWYPQMSSRAYRLVTDFGHKLINFDIRVWWPIDQEFFRGTIVRFDSEKKLHTIHYLDEDVEMLDLTKECWHFAELEKLNPILELETYQGPPPPRPKRGGGSKKRRRH